MIQLKSHCLKQIAGSSPDNDGIYDELYGVSDIKFTNVSFNPANSANREMTIIFTADENRGGGYTCLIKIDSHGRVNVDIDDTPWEGGGVSGEITEIIMKYVTKMKYL